VGLNKSPPGSGNEPFKRYLIYCIYVYSMYKIIITSEPPHIYFPLKFKHYKTITLNVVLDKLMY
jgi:hypothetical protein